MSKAIMSESTLNEIANSIIERDGTTQPMTASEMPLAIKSIEKPRINFFDYDGTILYSYSQVEFLRLTSLPPNPTHQGLISQGWNYTLEDARAEVLNHGYCDIGQMYITDDGKTRLYIEMGVDGLAPYLGLAINGTVIVDWGDGSETITLTGQSLTDVLKTQHTYINSGSYIISIQSINGQFTLIGDDEVKTSLVLTKTETSNKNNNIAFITAIRKVEFGNNIQSIGNYAFAECYTLNAIAIPSELITFGNCAFTNCNSLNYVTIPTGTSLISNGLFKGCFSLSTVSIPSSCLTIDGEAFCDCESMFSISLPRNIITIGDNVFNDCEQLQFANIPKNIETFGAGLFNCCYLLDYIQIPDHITDIPNDTFDCCYGLKHVELQPNITSIGSYAFCACYALESFTVPNGVTTLEQNVFSWCYRLKSIIIPNSVTSIGGGAFSGCQSLHSIIIPNSIVSIGNSAFQNCPIYSIIIPDSVTSIGDSIFSGDRALQYVKLSNNITSIPKQAFYNCYSLRTITIPENVNDISNTSFNYCCSLHDIHFKSLTPPTITNGATKYVSAWAAFPADCILYIPAGTLEAYQAATGYPSNNFVEEEI